MFSLLTPIATRAFTPAYASFTSSSTLSLSSLDDEQQRERPFRNERMAIQANTSPAALLRHLHLIKTGSVAPVDSVDTAVRHGGADMAAEQLDTCVKVLGWQPVGDHVEYTILSSCRGLAALSEARLVQRRYRDFAKLHSKLNRRARQAGFEALPDLPPKFTYGIGRSALCAQRQAALHEWLGKIVAHPLLWPADELRSFLGLPPKALARHTSTCVVARDEDVAEATAEVTTSPAPVALVLEAADEATGPASIALSDGEQTEVDCDEEKVMKEEEMAPRTMRPRADDDSPLHIVAEGCAGPFLVDLAQLEAKALECLA